MVDFQRFHDAKEWARDVARFGVLLAHKLPIPDPRAPTGRWDPESPQRQAALLQALGPKTMRMDVVGLRDETPTTRTLVLRRADGPKPVFRAGQYLAINLSVDGVRTSRPYSISSPPGKDVIEVTVKALPGEWVPNYLASRIQLRDKLVTSGPKGHFYYEPLTDGDDLVFLAGGSGITPFLSMLLQMESEGFRGTVELLYGNRSNRDVIFGEALAHLQSHVSWLRVHHLFSDQCNGRPAELIDAANLQRILGRTEGRTFFVCGPRALYQTTLAALEQMGVRQRQIRREVYGPPRRPEQEEGWPEGLLPSVSFPVEIERGPTIQAKAGEPLLNSLERAGVAVPAVCRTGSCSACRVKRLEGEVFIPPGVTIREADLWEGYIHSCTAYPIAPLRIRCS